MAGTSREHVVDDYSHRLSIGTDAAESLIADLTTKLLQTVYALFPFSRTYFMFLLSRNTHIASKSSRRCTIALTLVLSPP